VDVGEAFWMYVDAVEALEKRSVMGGWSAATWRRLGRGWGRSRPRTSSPAHLPAGMVGSGCFGLLAGGCLPGLALLTL
jgi:hypothetical protein